MSTSEHARLTFHPADARLTTRVGREWLDVREVIAFHVVRPFVESGIIPPDFASVVMARMCAKPQLVAINGVPC